jgi:hypothetical protein
MTRTRKLTIGLAFALSGTCFAAPPAMLLSMEQPLTFGAAIFGLGLVGTAAWELVSMKRDADVSQLAQAVESRSLLASVEAAEDSAPAVNPLLAGRASSSRFAPEPPSASGRPAPPPPPGARASEPPAPPSPASAVYTPPPVSAVAPPPPPPAVTAEVNPFAKLSQGEDDTVSKAMNKPPIALSGSPEPPPKEPGTESGGWADLMQKVRTAKENETGPLTPAAPPAKPSGQGGAWEALLKKTTSSSEVLQTGPASSLPRPTFPPSPSASGEGMPAVPPAAPNNPFSNLAPPPPPAPQEEAAKSDNVPDFIRKASASRTISLDFGKGFDGKL